MKKCSMESRQNMPSINLLEGQRLFLEEHKEIDCVGTNMRVFDKEGKRGVRKCPEHPEKKMLLTQSPFAHPTIMMKRSVYDELGGYSTSKETMRAEDLELWFRFFFHGYSGYNIQDELYLYREDLSDYKKRTLYAGVMTAKINIKGYRMLGFPIYKWIFALKPVISAITPNVLNRAYHNR